MLFLQNVPNAEEVRMAKELNFNPRTLIWKAPVKIWVRDLWEERQLKLDWHSRREFSEDEVTF